MEKLLRIQLGKIHEVALNDFLNCSQIMSTKVSNTPLLKWPGGKRKLVKHILPIFPSEFNKYYEPFLGGAALFLSLKNTQALLSDINEDLINCYIQVKNNPEAIIEKSNKLINSEEEYYRIRDKFKAKDEIEKAVRFLYLNRLAFNGIYRLNLKGKFNVPYGYKRHLSPIDEELIRKSSLNFRKAEFKCTDFESAVKGAVEGDVVYFDPPYTVAHGNNGFVKYNDKIFSWKDQVRLRDVAYSLSERRVKVIISNADHTSISDLYKDFNVRVIDRFSIIAASKSNRKKITECLIHN